MAEIEFSGTDHDGIAESNMQIRLALLEKMRTTIAELLAESNMLPPLAEGELVFPYLHIRSRAVLLQSIMDGIITDQTEKPKSLSSMYLVTPVTET